MPCLAFAVLGGEVTGLLARDGEVHAFPCGPFSGLREELAAFRFQVHRRLHGAADEAAAAAALERIAARVLGRAPDLGAGELCVVLPPELGSLPLDALPGLPDLALSYAACAAHAGPVAEPRLSALVVGIGSESLPEVRREVSSVLRLLPGAQVLQGDTATREAILASLPGRGIVHLAGHAQAREDLPLMSALRVSDGYLTASDLRDPDLDRSLVLLSACRTGDPALRWHGEAMGGFPRALLAAGAGAIVASRWEVRDEVAHAWMRHFYRCLDRQTPAEAVHEAARRVRSAWPHPADWAAFLLIRGGPQRST